MAPPSPCPPRPLKAGYIFDGWFTNPTGGTALDLALHPGRLFYPLRPVDGRADHCGSHPFEWGHAVRISTYVDASAANATSVEFVLFGGSYGYSAPVICTATSTVYGWLCSWNSTTVPNGSYVLVLKAFNSAGSTFSSGVSITVKNPLPTTAVLIPSKGATLSGPTTLTPPPRTPPASSSYSSAALRLFRSGALHGHVDSLRVAVCLEHHDGPQRFLRPGVRGL